MPTTRETVLAALHARLQSLAALVLRDGQPGEPEVTLSPPRYHHQHRAELEVVFQSGTERASAFDTLTASIGTELATDRTLGGICDWVEAEAPQPADLPVEGAAILKAAAIAVVLHYSLSDPLSG
ncbi:acyl-CoA transferase [uncultured Roseovarius sp.]|uniref:acyl-CoA transferase n=1 Tax=uncultured Roseovarius sp. TaxID=293344 RepID=UPI00262F8BBC|nr:acyl-CoA transferase [uncultured Roseovarius sp.]